jgi:hypothetical protein
VGIFAHAGFVVVFDVAFSFSASYFSLLAQRTSNQKKVHPSFGLYPALLGLPGGHRNSP